jgi:hypothetical protein
MKELTVHWVEMRTYEFPDDAPINDINALGAYVDKHPQAKGDWEYFCVKHNTRDWEMVT